MIKKKEIDQIIKSYKGDGYVNIFLNGNVGVGKTTFGSQLLQRICKRLDLEVKIERLYFNFTDFINSDYSVKYLTDDILKVEFLNSCDYLDKLKGKINILDIYDDRDLNEFELNYFKFDILDKPTKENVRRKGYYKYNGMSGKFQNKDIFNMSELYKKKKEHLMNNINTNNPRSSRDIKPKILLLPNLPSIDFEKKLIKDRLDLILQVKGSEGTGKSSVTKENILDLIKRHNKPISKRLFKLFGLFFIYSLLLSILLGIIGIFGLDFYIITLMISTIISWEIFFKPIMSEAKKLW